jgi:hypothetical protein
MSWSNEPSELREARRALVREALEILDGRAPLPVDGAVINEKRIQADLLGHEPAHELWGRIRWRWLCREEERAREAARRAKRAAEAQIAAEAEAKL